MPAVTICPESKTDADRFNLTRILDMIEANETVTENDLITLQALSQICDIETGALMSPIVKNRLQTVDASHLNIQRKLLEIKSNFINLSSIAFVSDSSWSLNRYARELITSEGVCYTFNMLDRRDLYRKEVAKIQRFPTNSRLERSNWTVFGYTDDNDPNAYPYRIIGSGKKAGISIALRMRRKDIDYACKDTAESFRLTLHTPDEFPMPTARFHKIPFDTETLIVLQPRVMSTSDNMRHYKPVKRQCYFPEEKRLKFFKSYTQTSCKLECLASELCVCKCFSVNLKHFRAFNRPLRLRQVLHATRSRVADLQSKGHGVCQGDRVSLDNVCKLNVMEWDFWIFRFSWRTWRRKWT